MVEESVEERPLAALIARVIRGEFAAEQTCVSVGFFPFLVISEDAGEEEEGDEEDTHYAECREQTEGSERGDNLQTKTTLDTRWTLTHSTHFNNFAALSRYSLPTNYSSSRDQTFPFRKQSFPELTVFGAEMTGSQPIPRYTKH